MTKASFGRKRDQRQLLLRNLATSVILYESVVTTEAKGRSVQPIVERLLRIAQGEDTLTARRRLLAYITDENAVNKVLNELTVRFNDRTSGFTRRFRLPARAGDGAPQVVVQLAKTVLLEDKSAEKAATPSEKVSEATEEDRHE